MRGTLTYQFFMSLQNGLGLEHLKGFFFPPKIPWWSYAAVEYMNSIRKHDGTKLSVVEYGTGYSTYYWAGRKDCVYHGVEDNEEWFKKVRKNAGAHCDLYHIRHKESYVEFPSALADSRVDILIIDGSHRYECAKFALTTDRIQPAIIVLDDANWFPKSASILRRGSVTEIPFIGYSPRVHYKKVTSLFIVSPNRVKQLRGNKYPVPAFENFETHIR